MSYYRDYRRRNSFSYKVKRWLWADHREEVKTIFRFIGEFIIAFLWFAVIVILPHFFR